MIDRHAIDALLQQIEPWLALLDAQSLEQTGGDLELRQAFFGELRNATQDFAQAAQKSSLRGLCNVAMLLLRGMDTRINKPLDDDDIGQLTLWLSGVQSYLDATLDDSDCLLRDLQALPWVPKLAPSAISMLQDRLREATVGLNDCAQERATAETTNSVDCAKADGDEPNADKQSADEPAQNDTQNQEALENPAFAALLIDDSEADSNPISVAAATSSYAPTPVVDSITANSEHFSRVYTPPETGSNELAQAQIWIANEEFQLVTETVQSRLLPCLSELAQATGPAKLAEHYAEAQYQIELLSNAFEVLGLEQSRKMCHVLLQSLAAPGADAEAVISERAPAMMHWIVMLVDFCDRPDNIEARESWVNFVATEDWFAQITPAHSEALKQEIANISVGLDPRLMAARKTEISAEETELSPAADVMPNVLQGMLIELPENARALSINIENFVLSGDVDSLDSARRVAHTLKGDANTVGIKGIANLTHSLEDIFIELAKQPAIPSRAFANLLMQASDCVSSMADHVLGRGEAPSDALSVMQEILNVANSLSDGTPISELEFADSVSEVAGGENAPSQHARVEESALQTAERLAQFNLATAPAARAATVAPADVPMLQIPADVLDRLLDFSSEALVLLRQIETQIKSVDEGQAEIERQRQDGAALLVELDNAVNLRGVAMQSSRKQGQEIDPLEMDQYNELYTVTRRLMEVSADEQTSRNVIERAARSLIELAAEQEKVQLELQDQIMRTRQVSVKDFVGRFQRAVRQTSKMLDKDVDFVVTGQDTMIDRVQMENLVDPLMHALRNSVDHGVEQQSMRLTRGKPISGQVNLGFARDGRSVSVKLSDDGAGLNYERIRAKAIQGGFIKETDQVSNDDLAQIILLPGFSTKEEVSQVSGRGIGLDVVYQRIQDLRGSLAIRSKQGSGMTMDIRLPASMTSLYCGLTQLDGGWAAIASDSVESFQLIEPYFCEVDGEQVYVTIDGERMPLLDLEALIGGVRSRIQIPEQPGVGVLVRSVSGEPQLGFLPEIKEMRTVIVKDFGPYLRTFPGVRGGTILGDGTVAPVIDARELMRNTAYQPWSARDESYRAALAKTVKLRALIADDSLSVRRALEQLLTDAGFEVFAARDGLEALALIKESNPDILLLDLEMPRMNGLEVAAFVRKDSELGEVPIIMITSRTSEKHVQMAKAAGVNDILSKPYAEDALLDLIQTHLGIVVKKAA
jgi:chemotaxis protein histidine kinase CheA/ActR/RegA family two-component response regulator